MTFVCQRCGDCCSTMGEIISIQEQSHPYEFRIGFTNGEERVVSVDPDKRVLFHDRQQQERKSLACPVLRERAPHELSARYMPAGLISAGITSVPTSSFSAWMETKQDECCTGPGPSPRKTAYFSTSGTIPSAMS
jgi:hypothetical protein